MGSILNSNTTGLKVFLGERFCELWFQIAFPILILPLMSGKSNEKRLFELEGRKEGRVRESPYPSPSHVDVAVRERPHVHGRLGDLVVAPRRVAEHVAHRQERQNLPVLVDRSEKAEGRVSISIYRVIPQLRDLGFV